MPFERAPGGLGLWAGFLDQLPAEQALAVVREVANLGVRTIWLQEYSGVDPFVRAALYLGAGDQLTVALGVATIHARDAEAMVATATTLEDAFPGRFLLGLGVSHRHLAQSRGHVYSRPLETMRAYLVAMDECVGRRHLPTRFLGGLGPRMTELGGAATDGVHTYFAPVAHTAATREIIGAAAWLAPTQLVAVGAAGPDWREAVRPYLGLCLGMPSYRQNLIRFGLDEAQLDRCSDEVVDAIVVPDDPDSLAARVAEHRAAGADHVVIQFVPPPSADRVVSRLAARPLGWAQ